MAACLSYINLYWQYWNGYHHKRKQNWTKLQYGLLVSYIGDVYKLEMKYWANCNVFGGNCVYNTHVINDKCGVYCYMYMLYKHK